MVVHLSPLDFLQVHPSKRKNDIEKETGLVILNSPISSQDLLNRLWTNTSYRVAADGGANRLHDLYSGWEGPLRISSVPDEIHGDLDSLRDDVRQFYAKYKVPITQDDDQYHTDFEKSIGRVLDKVSAVKNMVVLGSLSGRVDQGIGILSEFYRKQLENPSIQFWLFSEASISFVLDKGETIIHVSPDDDLITRNVGILPVFGPASITIRGFEWDVEDWKTKMGSQVSTSNHIVSRELSVRTDAPVLFTIERGAEK